MDRERHEGGRMVVLENHEDPEQLLFEIGSIWNKRKNKKDVDGEADF